MSGRSARGGSRGGGSGGEGGASGGGGGGRGGGRQLGTGAGRGGRRSWHPEGTGSERKEGSLVCALWGSLGRRDMGACELTVGEALWWRLDSAG